jgi:hypothetical protein
MDEHLASASSSLSLPHPLSSDSEEAADSLCDETVHVLAVFPPNTMDFVLCFQPDEHSLSTFKS